MFEYKKYIAKSIAGAVPVMLRILLQDTFDTTDISENDYFQIFNFPENGAGQKKVRTDKDNERGDYNDFS